jgi:hypothetical protein
VTALAITEEAAVIVARSRGDRDMMASLEGTTR